MSDLAVEQAGTDLPEMVSASEHDDGAFAEVDGQAGYEFE